MNGQVNNAEYDFLWKLLANPADPNHSYIFSLQSLVADFPQSGALRALLMPNGDKRHVKHAAAYFNPVLLHKLATAPDSLPRVSAEQIIFCDDLPPVSSDIHYNIPQAEPFVPPVLQPEVEYLPVIDDDVVTESADQAPEADDHTGPGGSETASDVVDPSRQDTPAYINDDRPAEDAPATFHQEPQEQTTFQPLYTPSVSSEDLAKEYEQYMAKTEITPTEPVSSYEEDAVRYFHQPIDDEVYDEIVSIEDIGLEQLAILNKSARESENDDNYFVFEPAIDDDAKQRAEPELQPAFEEQAQNRGANQPVPALAGSNPSGSNTKDDVSKYNDEKMPYTFMWWLDKTRKEHAYIYQPYVSNSAPAAQHPKQTADERPVLDELQKQYYQNIVSNTSLAGLYDDPPKMRGNQPPVRKEDKIIERFIQEEPHIKHPTDMKLDNENKAKRSSEDKEELVTETLARIYTEQMLYHKAVITYKKLMLKYPEKSLYFAGQIEQLENKIN